MNGRELMKSFVGQTTITGKYEEDLEEVVSAFDDMEEMCECSQMQKRKAMAIILNVPTKDLFYRHDHVEKSYDQGIYFLRQRYNGKEKQTRLLME